MRISMTGLAVLAFAVAGSAAPVAAQEDQPRPRIVRRAPLRIEIEPSRRLVRACADRFVIEQRYAGPTVVPRTQCWWAVR
jgi:hypothetical protein